MKFNRIILSSIIGLLLISLLGACNARKTQAENQGKSEAATEAVQETAAASASEITEESAEAVEEEIAEAEEMETEEEKVYTVVEEMPMYPGCKAFTAYHERKACAANKFYQYTLKNLTYPPQAMEAGVQGTVVIGFTVMKDGSLDNVRILKDIGFGCGEAALKIVNSMPTWEPGLKEGKPVNVRYQLPVKFKLQ